MNAESEWEGRDSWNVDSSGIPRKIIWRERGIANWGQWSSWEIAEKRRERERGNKLSCDYTCVCTPSGQHPFVPLFLPTINHNFFCSTCIQGMNNTVDSNLGVYLFIEINWINWMNNSSCPNQINIVKVAEDWCKTWVWQIKILVRDDSVCPCTIPIKVEILQLTEDSLMCQSCYAVFFLNPVNLAEFDIHTFSPKSNWSDNSGNIIVQFLWLIWVSPCLMLFNQEFLVLNRKVCVKEMQVWQACPLIS